MWGEIPEEVPAAPAEAQPHLICSGESDRARKAALGTGLAQRRPIEEGQEEVVHGVASDWKTAQAQIVDSVCARCGDSGLFKSQQRGDPDLTAAEKASLARKLLVESPAKFLARFGRFLDAGELASMEKRFAGDDGDYEVTVRLKQLGAEACREKVNIRIRNRRYAAVSKMVNEGDEYFSETSMRRRKPLLYHRMVGRFLTDEQRAAVDADNSEAGSSNCRLTNIILEHVDINRERDLKKAQEREEESTGQEFDSESDDDEEEENSLSHDRLLAEFKEVMTQGFVRGEDADTFDYRRVDNDESLDDLETLGRDEEDRYFEDEEEGEEDRGQSETVMDESEYDY